MTYFKFKQFTVEQDKTAMKVTTDACLFGAWIAAWLRRYENANHHKIKNILDIGAGTGLLSLMIAQKSTAFIHAIEINNEAFEQASENINKSRWREKIKLLSGDVKSFVFEKRFELIISNPPFFEKNLKSVVDTRNLAMHDTGLTFEELVDVVKNNLTDAGWFAALLPFQRVDYFVDLTASQGLLLDTKFLIKPTPTHSYTRAIGLFKLANSENENDQPSTEELIIKEVHHNYSIPFITLLEDYYLSL